MFRHPKPLIGILANFAVDKESQFPGQEKIYVNRDYITALEQAGAIPILLPMTSKQELIRAHIQLVDGILISGGYDLHPFTYGEEPHPKLEEVCPERDHYEIEVVQVAASLKKPILGICRGLQLMNVAFGGSLYQDMSLHQPKTTLQHWQKGPIDMEYHTVTIETHTKLYTIVGEKQLVTNTFHHQAIHRLATCFQVSARSFDQVIEAIESPEADFLIGVQWHPEKMIHQSSPMRKLFKAFVEAANRYIRVNGKKIK
jgi:putative glutamine amidotransferase